MLRRRCLPLLVALCLSTSLLGSGYFNYQCCREPLFNPCDMWICKSYANGYITTLGTGTPDPNVETCGTNLFLGMTNCTSNELVYQRCWLDALWYPTKTDCDNYQNFERGHLWIPGCVDTCS
jgi:hypothetical protein